MAENKPLLDLSTLAPETLYIAIDGEKYPLKRISDMGVREQARIMRIGQRIQELYASTVHQDLREAQQALAAALDADPDAKQQATRDLQDQTQLLARDLYNIDLSDTEAREIEETIGGFLVLTVDAPPDVLDKLNLHQKSQIIQVFTKASGMEVPEARESLPTGAE